MNHTPNRYTEWKDRMNSRLEWKEKQLNYLSRFCRLEKDSDELTAILIMLFSIQTDYHSPYVIANSLKLYIVDVRKYFYNWSKSGVYDKRFVDVDLNNKAELLIMGVIATDCLTCRLSLFTVNENPRPKFTPLDKWPANIPPPNLTPYQQPDGKSYSGRERYNELVDYCMRRKNYSVVDKLQPLLPLYDAIASKVEQRDYIHKYTRHFPVVSRRKQLLDEIQELAGKGW